VAAAAISDSKSDDGDRDGSAHHAGTAGATYGTREGVDVINSQASLADGQGQAADADAADAHRAGSWDATADGEWYWYCWLVKLAVLIVIAHHSANWVRQCFNGWQDLLPDSLRIGWLWLCSSTRFVASPVG
jgi:hypothetical protein